MRKILAALVLSTFTIGAVSAFAADMTSEERAELRARAEALQAQQAQNGNHIRSDVNLNQNRGDVRLNDNPSDVKQVNKTKKAKKTKRNAKAKGQTQSRT